MEYSFHDYYAPLTFGIKNFEKHTEIIMLVYFSAYVIFARRECVRVELYINLRLFMAPTNISWLQWFKCIYIRQELISQRNVAKHFFLIHIQKARLNIQLHQPAFFFFICYLYTDPRLLFTFLNNFFFLSAFLVFPLPNNRRNCYSLVFRWTVIYSCLRQENMRLAPWIADCKMRRNLCTICWEL